jgi:hypothetical protein
VFCLFFVFVRPQYGFRRNRSRYSVMECRILFWMQVGLDVFYPEKNVARLPFAQNVVSNRPIQRRRRRFVRRRVASRRLRRVEPLPYDPMDDEGVSTRGSSPTEDDWAIVWDLTVNGPIDPSEHGTRAWWRECCFFKAVVLVRYFNISVVEEQNIRW